VSDRYAVYILTNRTSKVLYVGVTGNLEQRLWQHRTKANKGFTAKCNVSKLVYVEYFGDVTIAIAREKQIKGWSRSKKLALI
jgi:putative endonuclease